MKNEGKGFIIFLLGMLFTAQLMAQSTPTGLEVTAYDSHFELNWEQSFDPNIVRFRIYRSKDEGETFELLSSVNTQQNTFIDFVGRRDVTYIYRLSSQGPNGQESNFSVPDTATTFEMTDEELLTMVQEYTFRYFWDFANPISGLARERNTTNIVTTGGSGFGIMAILVGIERGFITRAQGLQRLIKIADFLENKADRFQGVWSHWLNGGTGEVIPFSRLDNGGDLVETCFLLQGLLTAREYFNEESEEETALRNTITRLWEEVDFNWYRKQTENVLWWHWSPEFDFQLNLPIRGYNEALIIYLLGVASPTNSIPPSLYHDGWAGNSSYTNGFKYFGIELPLGPSRGGPLFFAHYSYIGLDPRGIEDDYANYFIQNINHTLINREYCIENPRNFKGYGPDCWGLTASDDPIRGYWAHSPVNDNGTITPTAAISSMPYTPEQSIAAMKHFYREYGEHLWGPYGFYDAFNLTENWFADSYLAIDQGPIICMIENYRSELLWKNFMANPEITQALNAIGFRPSTTAVSALPASAFEIFPNPVSPDQIITIKTEQIRSLELILYDTNGRRLLTHQSGQGQVHQLSLQGIQLAEGPYFLQLRDGAEQATEKILIKH